LLLLVAVAVVLFIFSSFVFPFFVTVDCFFNLFFLCFLKIQLSFLVDYFFLFALDHLDFDVLVLFLFFFMIGF